MSANDLQSQGSWTSVCSSGDVLPNLGVRALVNGVQIALFRVQNKLYAVGAMDPFSNAAVLSRGIVGDLQGQVVVASPIYKQHFNLATGACLEDENVSIPVFSIKEENDQVWVEV